MPKDYYCWRAGKVIPMLDESEWSIIEPFLKLDNVKAIKREQGCTLSEAKRIWQSRACDKFFELTGYRETVFNVLFSYRISSYGPECKHCNQLLRTPEASFCAYCGKTVNQYS